MSATESFTSGNASPSLGAGAVEHGQTMIIDDNLSHHRRKQRRPKAAPGRLQRSASFAAGESTALLRRSSSIPSILEVKEYGARGTDQPRTIRFQVVIWYIGKVDVVTQSVPVTFRVTIFWNASDDEEVDLEVGSVSSQGHVVWSMHGRQQAFQRELHDNAVKSISVPPVSILNVVTFDTIGSPEVAMLNDATRLMRWTCMYRATLIQDDMTVETFPHDMHEITLKLAILAHRGKGRQWDRDVWKLALATNSDSQGSTQVPHGLIVSQVQVPEFYANKESISFKIVPIQHGGPVGGGGNSAEQCLEVKFSVLRESGYYDKNIMPLLGLLNLVAVSIVCLPPDSFFQRGLLTMNIAFVEIGIRMTTDSHLPSVAYQIKMQRILNEYFCGLLCLVLESILVYVLYVDCGWSIHVTNCIDWTAAILSLLHNSTTIFMYYSDVRQARRKIRRKPQSNTP